MDHTPRYPALIVVVIVSLGVSCSRQLAEDTPEMADRILITKSEHKLELLKRNHVLRTYKVALGRGASGAKEKKGDHKTPEGEYIVDAKNSDSRFHLALHLSYPNEADLARADRLGVSPGGDVEIHGIQNGLGWLGRLHRQFDWTDGCIAVTDDEIQQIWRYVTVGTPVEIKH